MKGALQVVASSSICMIQDLGRIGQQRFGVPVSGALDSVSLRIANALVGNSDGTAALEMFYRGPTLEVAAESVRVASIGAPLTVASRGASRPVAAGQSVRVTRGERIKVGLCDASLVAYLAIEGGFALPGFLGSLSTFVRAGLGGIDGRPLKKGDALPLALASAPERDERRVPAAWNLAPPARVHVVFGPQDDYFSERGKRTFTESTYTVSMQSDRMGMRLEGPALEHAKGFNIVSDGTAPGSIQVPGNGLPIVLLADRPTTGGYPKIATVASADLPALGRLRPDAKIGFDAISVEEAEAARRELEARIAELRASLKRSAAAE
ncbi:MAG TPA: biotin-dependent carboxyltransferase family protein [Burkholderiales bacterium]|nr:biotin-dependent carboxyltransferase family protein [Burkholderiales bacterium]